MSLQDRLVEDIKDAMRQKDELRRTTLRMIRSAIQYEEIAKREPLDDIGVVDILSRMVRQHQESITEFQRGNRPDMVEREEAELEIVRNYLPEQLSGDEIAELARKIIADVGAAGPGDMGKVMGQLMPHVRGKADGGEVSRVVTELLAG
jgi:uncharacterized protein YqeY